MLSGPGGVGKSTLARRLAGADPGLWLSTSWTTRSRREGEDPGAYVFVDRESFIGMVEKGGFLEWAEFNGNLYGTPLPGSEAGEATGEPGSPPQGADILLEIDVQGARQVRERDPRSYVILVTAPSWPEVEWRMRERGDSEEAIARRVGIGRREEEEGRLLADRVVVNDDLDATVAELAGIIAARRSDLHGSVAGTSQ